MLVKQHGDCAAAEALRRADEMAMRSDTEGCAAWRRIATAVRELERRGSDNGKSIN